MKKGIADTKVAEERESWQEEAASMKVIPVGANHASLKLKVQRPSFDMLQTLQWTG